MGDLERAVRLVVFDQCVAYTSPAGSCVLAEVEGLASTRSVTVFSARCDIAGLTGVEWQRVPLPAKPLVLRYVLFQLVAPVCFLIWRIRHWHEPIRIQTTQGQFVWADVAYAHYCHTAYLRGAWKVSSVKGIRRVARWLNHSFNAQFERLAFRRARRIVVPSAGLAAEIAAVCPDLACKTEVLPNPVDIERFQRPESFDRAAFRSALGFSPSVIVSAFVALGDFSRKGLGMLIEVLALLDTSERSQFCVLVIGGGQSEIREFSDLARARGVGECVKFVGLQRDVRPYLWASDVMVFPSAYETFSLGVFQAAAAGVPALIADGLYGAGDLIRDGQNGWVAVRSVPAVLQGVRRILSQRDALMLVSEEAMKRVACYSKAAFIDRWCEVYRCLELNPS